MKKSGIAALAAVVALAMPVTASAGGKAFSGAFIGGGTLSFTVKKTNHGKKVVKFAFHTVPADCTSGAETTSGNITFGIKVKHNSFKTDAVAGNPQHPDAALHVAGDIQGDTAEGTLRVHGSSVLIDGRGTSKCDTGTVHWNAGH